MQTQEKILHPDCSRPFWIQTLLCQLWSLPGPCLGSVWPQVHGLAVKMAKNQTKTQVTLTNSATIILHTNFRGFSVCKIECKTEESTAHTGPQWLTCTLWGSPVILRGLSAPVGIGSSWIIIICTPVLSWKDTSTRGGRDTQKHHRSRTVQS